MSHKQAITKHNIKAVILAGGRDFGRCPLASRLPTGLWPVMGRAVLERLVLNLERQHIKQAVICSNSDGPLYQESIKDTNSIQLTFLNEQLPGGTAGCVRDAISSDANTLFLVLHAGIMSLPSIDKLIHLHRAGKSDLTVMFELGCEDGEPSVRTSGIYVCEPTVLGYIPNEGYCDIKETLIPTMLSKGGTVHAAMLNCPTGSFRNRAGYLAAIAAYLGNSRSVSIDFPHRRWNGSEDIWVAKSARVDPSARIYGPAVIMGGSTVSENAVIFGPTIIEQNVGIGEKTLVENSVLWKGSSIGRNCEVHDCVVDYNAVIPHGHAVEKDVVVHEKGGRVENISSNASAAARGKANKLQSAAHSLADKLGAALPNATESGGLRFNALKGLAISILTILFLWSYWPSFVDLWNIWQRSDEYSSGLLVPFLAIYVLWSRRHDITNCPIRPCILGLFAFVAAQGIRLIGLFLMYGSLEMLSIALSIAALVLFFFGWRLFRKVSTILLFLCLMLPWPKQVEAAVALPLQRWATSSAVFCLQIMGYEVVAEGNIIHIGQATVAVAEACNGLRMITAFFVIGGLVALLVERAWWQKLIVLASCLPIALVCNTARLTITAIAFTIVNHENLEVVFHDFGGYAMMPLALAGIVAELWLLAKLTTPPAEQERMVVIRQKW